MPSSIYEHDFLLWTEQQAALLRAGKLAELDSEHLLEEIESMGKEQKLALQSLLRLIMLHLLKLDYSPANNPRNKWIEELLEFRAQAENRLEETPSLHHYADELFAKAWPQARRMAIKTFNLYGEKVVIPLECPYTLQQVLDSDFLPDRPQRR